MTVLSDFTDRLFYQFRDSPHITALIEIICDPIQDQVNVSNFILDSASIDDAEGEQLEMLGEIIGVERPPAQETNTFRLVRLGEVQDPDRGFATDENPGGYMVGYKGLAAVDGSEMSDTDYRYLIRQKAASYRTIMTRANIFEYLLAFGARCKIDDNTKFNLEIEPINYYDFDQWTQYYIVTRGFAPGGIMLGIVNNTHEDSI